MKWLLDRAERLYARLPYYIMGVDVDEHNVPTYVIINRTTGNLVAGPDTLYEPPWWFTMWAWVGRGVVTMETNGLSAELVAAMRERYGLK